LRKEGKGRYEEERIGNGERKEKGDKEKKGWGIEKGSKEGRERKGLGIEKGRKRGS
jgi:hypothetical protein